MRVIKNERGEARAERRIVCELCTDRIVRRVRAGKRNQILDTDKRDFTNAGTIFHKRLRRIMVRHDDYVSYLG